MDTWVDLLAEHGPALVRLGSRRGYLERLRDGDEIVVALRDAWREPVRGLLGDIGLPDAPLEHALFLSNMIFDPREIRDLLRETGPSRREVVARLTEAYCGTPRGWVRAG
ncbi:hypothetical protein OIE75_27805 [Streptomyces sp. NBC_01723]|uniref:hypothetical protein n=1 Tax=Streptomyces sp. NBC_01723 TaxID=2975921 RepID=UPI002E2EBCDC|nr:hypothetical protein [Streptomyces sp. NBC_01723]